MPSKPISESARKAKLLAAQSLLEEADERVTEYEREYRNVPTMGRPMYVGEKAYWKAHLDLWKRIQKTAISEVTKYGGAVHDPVREVTDL
jgi:hypothetical protein